MVIRLQELEDKHYTYAKHVNGRLIDLQLRIDRLTKQYEELSVRLHNNSKAVEERLTDFTARLITAETSFASSAPTPYPERLTNEEFRERVLEHDITGSGDRSGRLWSDNEVADLINEARVAVNKIARKHRRSAHAIVTKLQHIEEDYQNHNIETPRWVWAMKKFITSITDKN